MHSPSARKFLIRCHIQKVRGFSQLLAKFAIHDFHSRWYCKVE
jgi:hypothetical protein